MTDTSTSSTTKPFWASKTLWANAIAIVASIAGVVGYGDILTPEMQTTAVGVVMGVVNIVLRIMTKTGVTAT